MSGGRGPVILFLLQNREAGRAKANINLIKIIIGLNKVKKEIKNLSEGYIFFYLEFINSE